MTTSTQTSAPPTSTPPMKKHHRIRGLVIALVAIVALFALVFFAGGGYYFSGQVGKDMLNITHGPITYDLTYKGVSTTQVQVAGDASHSTPDVLKTNAVYSIRTPGGDRFVLGSVVKTDNKWVVRNVMPNNGAALIPWTTAAEPVDVSGKSGPANLYREIWSNPTDMGLAYSQVPIAGQTGSLNSWLIAGSGAKVDTWAVMVHGKGGTQAEGLRSLLTVHSHGMTALMMSYRNDVGAPQTASREYTYGAEWPDLQAGVQYALDHGAKRIIIFGYSMGGSITASFLEHSALAPKVDAVVLDSPMLDVKQTVYNGAAHRSLPVVGLPIPTPLTWTAIQISKIRYGSTWYDANYLDDTSWVKQPILIFQGTDDNKVPLATSQQLAEARPEYVTLVVTQHAGHVESWNWGPTAYDDAIVTFLAKTFF